MNGPILCNKASLTCFRVLRHAELHRIDVVALKFLSPNLEDPEIDEVVNIQGKYQDVGVNFDES